MDISIIFTPAITAIIASYFTHKLTTDRFINELTIKKKEKEIFEAKEIINDFEKSLIERITITRDYLYELNTPNSDIKNPECELRKRYRDIIRKWNVEFDYRSNRLLRNGINENLKRMDITQSELREFHKYFTKNVNNHEVICRTDVNKKISELNIFQNKEYAFITSLHEEANKKWISNINKKKPVSKWIIHNFIDWLIKTTVFYILTSVILFLLTGIFH
ncbi:hypothetical protein [Pectobacterium polaris]|uniref:hypothetical protein n=1 Tax=Pectobacterium polaris TaxID=2042057 RepID=UPI001968AF8C|nr:hypothetical protein [Pectobacterium polaris]MBN3215706.1 hypothetical protein [Pectobacterium polaris]